MLPKNSRRSKFVRHIVAYFCLSIFKIEIFPQFVFANSEPEKDPAIYQVARDPDVAQYSAAELPVSFRPRASLKVDAGKRSLTIEGRRTKKDWKLYWKSGGKPQPILEESFRFSIPLPPSPQEDSSLKFDLLALGPDRKLIKGHFIVSNISTDAVKRPSRFDWTPALGVSYLRYSETLSSDFTEIATTAKVSVRYSLRPNWSLNFSGYGTVYPLSTNRAGVSARYFGAGLTTGYALPWPKSPFSLSIAAGGYFTTMLVSGGTFGYKNLIAPNLMVFCHQALKRGFRLTEYLKFAPILNATEFDPRSNQELAAGLSLRIPWKNFRDVAVAADFSRIGFLIETIQIVQTSTSLSMGVVF